MAKLVVAAAPRRVVRLAPEASKSVVVVAAGAAILVMAVLSSVNSGNICEGEKLDSLFHCISHVLSF